MTQRVRSNEKSSDLNWNQTCIIPACVWFLQVTDNYNNTSCTLINHNQRLTSKVLFNHLSVAARYHHWSYPYVFQILASDSHKTLNSSYLTDSYNHCSSVTFLSFYNVEYLPVVYSYFNLE
jgi:hypothetical protein